MIPQLYRLFDVQSFDHTKIAIYARAGDFPPAKIISDALEIFEGNISKPLLLSKNTWYYGPKKVMEKGRGPHGSPPVDLTLETDLNRIKLNYHLSVLRRGQIIIDSYENINRAIFLKDLPWRILWKGDHNIYENLVFEPIKNNYTDLEFTSCRLIGTINI